MSHLRLVARLDVKAPNLVKGVRLEGLRVVGSPSEHAARYAKAIKRCTNVIGVFPNDDAILRLVGAILAEQHHEWQTSDRRNLTMNNATVLDLEQPITLELEAA